MKKLNNQVFRPSKQVRDVAGLIVETNQYPEKLDDTAMRVCKEFNLNESETLQVLEILDDYARNG